MICAGIDPGMEGAFCVISASASILSIHPMPKISDSEIDIMAVHRLILSFKNKIDMVFLEKSQPFPKLSAATQFKIGKSFAIIETLLIINEIPYELVPPVTWTKAMHKGVNPKLKSKEKSLLIANRFFPGLSKIAVTKRGKLLDGVIDAALIALWGLRKHNGQI